MAVQAVQPNVRKPVVAAVVAPAAAPEAPAPVARLAADLLARPAAPEKPEAAPTAAPGAPSWPLRAIATVAGWATAAKQKAVDGLVWLAMGPMPAGMGKFEVTDWANQDLLAKANAKVAAERATSTARTATEQAAAERAALAKLGPRSGAYTRLAEAVAGDAIALRALQHLLVDGRLTGQDPTRDLLARLDAIATQPLAAGVDRNALLKALVAECDDPARIAQGDKNSCTATAATIVVARRDPAEYARLVGELARPEGVTRLAGGATVRRAAGWAEPGDKSRTQSVKLLQPALIEQGNGFLRYDAQADANRLPTVVSLGLAALAGVGAVVAFRFGRRLLALELAGIGAGLAMNYFGSGLIGPQAGDVTRAVTGRDYESMSVWRWNRDAAWKKVEGAIARGETVPAGLMLPIGGHQMLIEGIQDGWVTLTNPWGMRNRMPVAEVKARIVGINIPKRP